MRVLSQIKQHLKQVNWRSAYRGTLVALLCLELSGLPLLYSVAHANPGLTGPGAGTAPGGSGAGADTSVIGASPSLNLAAVKAPSFNYQNVIPGDFAGKMQQACQGSDLAGSLRTLGGGALSALAMSSMTKGAGVGGGAGLIGALGASSCASAMAGATSLQMSIMAATTTADSPGSSVANTQNFTSAAVGQSCGASDASAIHFSPIHCESVASPQDLQQMVAIRQSSLQQVICGAECRKAQLGVIENQVQCLKSQANLLTQLGTQLGQAFQAEFNYAREQNLRYKNDIQNRETQEKNLDLILKGQEGTPGLVKQRESTLDMVNKQIPQKIAEVQQTLGEIENSKSMIQDAVTQRKMAAAMECLKTNKMPGLRCSRWDKGTVSFKDFLSCRVTQNAVLGGGDSNGNGGVVNQSIIAKGQSNEQSGNLQAIFDNIESKTPNDVNAPLTGGSGDKPPSASGSLILKPADAIQNFGPLFSSVKVPGLDVKSQFTSYFNYCYNLNSRNIDQSAKLSTSDIYQANFQQNQKLRKIQADVQSSLGEYNQTYTQNLQSMTGKSLGIGTSQCTGNSPVQQTQCIKKSVTEMESARKNLQAQLTTLPMKMEVKGVKNSFPVNCQGLNGCITALTSAKVNIQTDKENLKTSKENFNNAEFTKAQNFASGAGQALSKASAVLKARLDAMNGALSSLGISSSLSPSPLKGEPLSPDAENGFKVPRNGLEGIASYVNPPLPDIADGKSLNMPAQLGSQKERAESTISRAHIAMEDLKQSISRCNSIASRNISSDLNQQLSALGEGSCRGHALCTNDRVNDMISDFNRMNRSMQGPYIGGTTSIPYMSSPGYGYPGAGYESSMMGGGTMMPGMMGGGAMMPGMMGMMPPAMMMSPYTNGNMYGSGMGSMPSSSASLGSGIATACAPSAVGERTEPASGGTPAGQLGMANRASCDQALAGLRDAQGRLMEIRSSQPGSSRGGAGVSASGVK